MNAVLLCACLCAGRTRRALDSLANPNQPEV